MTSSKRATARRRFHRLGFVAATAALLTGLLAPAPALGQPDDGPFPLIGTLEVKNAQGDPVSGLLVGADASHRLLVVRNSNQRIYELFDLDTLDPAGVRAFPAGNDTATAIDQVHGRLFTGTGATGSRDTENPQINVVNLLDDGEPPPTFDFGAVAGSATSDPEGMAVLAKRNVAHLDYDPAEDRLYAVTQAAGNESTADAAVMVHAVDAAKMVSPDANTRTDALIWSYRVPACGGLQAGVTRPGYLGHSSDGHLSFFCRESGVNPAGVVRVEIDPVLGASAQDAQNFRTEFFPVAADTSLGAVSGDKAGDRILVVAASGGNKLLVFDAAQRSWVGAAVLGPNNTKGVGADPSTGRVYVVTENVGLIVAEGAPLPTSNGNPYAIHDDSGDQLDFNQGQTGHPVLDPVTRRLFVGGGTANKIFVYEDQLPLPDDPPPANPDDRTSDIDEGPDTLVSYTGEASAYGAKVTNIGGLRGTGLEGALDPLPPDFPRPSDGDRTTFFGRVEDASLAGDKGGSTIATATATGISVDEKSESDLANLPPLPGQIAERMASASCSSARDGDQVDRRSGAEVSCDLEGDSVSAIATTEGEDEGEASVPSLMVASASSSAAVTRDAERGVVAEARAASDDVAITVPGLGAIHIGEVRNIATSTAHGRSGSTESKFEPTVRNVRLVGPDGRTAFECDQCDPFVVAEAISETFGPRVKADGPRPDKDPLVFASPGGAQAAVIEDPYSYWNDRNINNDDLFEVFALQVTIFHDTRTASREVVQLGAVLTGVRYEVNPAPATDPLDPASLAIELLDQAGEALAGGMFEVRTAAEVVAPDPLPDPDDGTGNGDEGDEDERENNEGEDGEGEDDGGGGSFANATADDDEGDGDDPDEEQDDGQDADDDEGDEGDDTEEGDGEGDEDGDDEIDDPLGDILDDPLGAGELIGACVTGEDGTGDCTFDDLEPGAYLVTQTAAPAGFAEAPPFPVVLTPGFASTVTFTNVKSAATIGISLSDTDGNPLPGGDFAVLADDGDGLLGSADVEVGRCTTGGDGTCQPLEVPVGAYVVHQASAPDGLEPADDVAFSFTAPGESAVLAFVNGRPAAPPVESAGGDAPFTPRPPSMVSSGSVDITPAPPVPLPVVTSEPLDRSPGSPLNRLGSVAGEALGFLTRSPAEAALFAGVWGLLLSPAYLASRRRKLIFVKEGT